MGVLNKPSLDRSLAGDAYLLHMYRSLRSAHYPAEKNKQHHERVARDPKTTFEKISPATKPLKSLTCMYVASFFSVFRGREPEKERHLAIFSSVCVSAGRTRVHALGTRHSLVVSTPRPPVCLGIISIMRCTLTLPRDRAKTNAPFIFISYLEGRQS